MERDAIKLSNIRFRWSPDIGPVLDLPEFRAGPGERIFVRGPSGSGKTTLLNLLGGVAVPEAGSVRALGTDLAQASGATRDAFRADHIGFVFQQFNLVPYLGLIDNVTLPCRFSRIRRERLAKRSVSAEDEAQRLLERMQLETGVLRGRPVSQLSVGQQQRVAVARALIGAPEIVIADEPTSALDEDATGAFLDLLFAEAGRDTTLVFVSHDARLGDLFDRVVELDRVNLAGQRG